MGDALTFVPISFSYVESHQLEVDAAAAALADASPEAASRLQAAGWEVAAGQRDVARVLFGSSQSVPAPRVMMDDDAAAEGAARASEDLDVTVVTARRNSEQLTIDVTRTESDLARAWKAWETTGVDFKNFARGRAGTGGDTATLDTGRLLIRLTYADGSKVLRPRSLATDVDFAKRRARSAEDVLRLVASDD